MSDTAFMFHGPRPCRRGTTPTAADNDDGFASRIAVMTAVLSTVGALSATRAAPPRTTPCCTRTPQRSKRPRPPTSGTTTRPRATKPEPGPNSPSPLNVKAKKKGETSRRPSATRAKGRNQEGSREIRGRGQGAGKEKRQVDAPAPPLGPGHDRHPDFHRHGGHQPAHPQALADLRDLSGGRRRLVLGSMAIAHL